MASKLIKQDILIVVYAFCFALMLTLSDQMPHDFKIIYWYGFGLEEIIKTIILGGVFTVGFKLVLVALDYVNSYLGKHTMVVRTAIIKTYLCIFLPIIMVWFVFWLSFFPGNISGDSRASINQYYSGINSNAHPVLYTAIVIFLMRIGFLFGGINAAIATYSVVQMIVLCGVLTYSIMWMIKYGISKYEVFIYTIYFALNPLIIRYSFTMWKDIFFSAVVFLVCLCLYDLDILNDRDFYRKPAMLRFCILSLLVVFLRNRMIYAVVFVYTVIVVLIKNRSQRTKWGGIFCIFVIATLFIQGPLYDQLNIKASGFHYGQGVSLQQIAYVVKTDGAISDGDKAFLEQIMPLEDIKKVYVECTSDNLMDYETFDAGFMDTHPKEYLEVYRHVLKDNPMKCVLAWLMTTRGFWGYNCWIQPFAITKEYDYLGNKWINIPLNYLGIDLVHLSNGLLVYADRVPVVRRILELGSLGWIGLFVLMRMIYKGKYREAVSILPLTLLWIVTIFSTPIFFEARYMFCYHLALPWLVYLTTRKGYEYNK